MSTYAYTDSKVVDQVHFRKVGNGAIRAYLHARDDADCEDIKQVIATLRNKDWECIPFTIGGVPTLEVRGFRREAELITFLDNNKIIAGTPKITKSVEDEGTWGDFFKKRTMQASGAAMMVADLGFISYGALEGSWQDTLAGLSYLSGSATLLAYGRNDQSRHQIRQVAELILDYAHAKGLDVSPDSAAATIGTQRELSTLGKLNTLFERYPSEIGNMCYVAAGGLIASSALKNRVLPAQRPTQTDHQYAEQRKAGRLDVGLGSLTVASGLLATFVKEKARDEDEPRKHGLAGIVEWIRESPLRLASYGYMGSTLFHAFTTYHESKEARRIIKEGKAPAVEIAKAQEKISALPGRKLFVTATLIGEFLLSISSKGHGEGVVSDKSVDDSAVAIMADLIVKQPDYRQEDLIQSMGKFLGGPKVLAIRDEEAIALLRKQVEIMRKNPWAKVEQEPVPLTPSAGLSSATHTVPKSALPAWQAKVASADASRPPLQTPA